jgi:hypothetical protein
MSLFSIAKIKRISEQTKYYKKNFQKEIHLGGKWGDSFGIGGKSLRKQSRSFEDWMVWVGYGTGRFCVLVVRVSFVESHSGS